MVHVLFELVVINSSIKYSRLFTQGSSEFVKAAVMSIFSSNASFETRQFTIGWGCGHPYLMKYRQLHNGVATHIIVICP